MRISNSSCNQLFFLKTHFTLAGPNCCSSSHPPPPVLLETNGLPADCCLISSLCWCTRKQWRWRLRGLCWLLQAGHDGVSVPVPAGQQEKEQRMTESVLLKQKSCVTTYLFIYLFLNGLTGSLPNCQLSSRDTSLAKAEKVQVFSHMLA